MSKSDPQKRVANMETLMQDVRQARPNTSFGGSVSPDPYYRKRRRKKRRPEKPKPKKK